MVMSRDQNAGQSQNMKTDYSSLESLEGFKCLGTTVTNQNSIQEELSTNLIWRMLAVIRCRIFCLPGCYPET
jgi:hypothetical protein